MGFEDTANKRCIRIAWDLPMLSRWAADVSGAAMKYFGLSGPNLYDLIAWREVLARERTSVEERGRDTAGQEAANESASRAFVVAGLEGIDGGFQLLRGNITDIIVDGADDKGEPPQVNDYGSDEFETRLAAAERRARRQRRTVDPSQEMRLRYDLVNLDFDGGLGNTTQRVEGIRQLFRRQKGHSFMLFLTFNVRSRLQHAIQYDLEGLRPLDRSPEWQRVVEFFLRSKTPVAAKLKALVPGLIRQAASEAGFRLIGYPAVLYAGHESATMVHFAFEVYALDTPVFRGISPHNDKELVSLPLLEVADGVLRTADLQHPGCTSAELIACLPHYPARVAALLRTITAEMPSS